MKISGFTFIKNAIIYDYPIVEAIQSILPICDEVVVAVGKSDDDTLKLIQAIDPHKIKIIETVWDESQRDGGRVLALETDKAFAAISKDADWAFYIQGDEVVHEKYLDRIYEAMKRFKDDERIDGLLFNYLHFYGSYDYIGSAARWYTHEIRVIKNNSNIFSYKDAQGFRKGDDQKLKVVAIDAFVYHYGWVKDPRAMQRKQENFHKYWHNDQWIEKHIEMVDSFDYHKHITQLQPFLEDHPKVMQSRIDQKNWMFSYDISFNKSTMKDRLKKGLKRYLHINTDYRNYTLLKPKKDLR